VGTGGVVNFGIELGDTPLVATSAYSAVDAEIGIKLVSLLHSRFRVEQAQIDCLGTMTDAEW
jgi:hypothetical protein